MSNEPALKVGDILTPVPTSSWGTWGKIELIGSMVFKGATYWWIKMTHNDGGTHLDTLSEKVILGGWEVKLKFYEIGKTYKFPLNRLDEWTILDLYVLRNPVNPDEDVKAVARMVTPEGYDSIETLTKNDFRRMVEVE